MSRCDKEKRAETVAYKRGEGQSLELGRAVERVQLVAAPKILPVSNRFEVLGETGMEST